MWNIDIPAGSVVLQGSWETRPDSIGIVLFAHGSGSSRHSPRNQYVARVLQSQGLATVLFDLLTEDEARRDAVTGALRFDVEFLAERLRAATEWSFEHATGGRLPIGYFGASTGAAAALIVAAALGDRIAAVVSRGGRPDLAPAETLSRVKSPTLLLVGSADEEVLALNRQALAALGCEKRLEVVPGASHLFEEPGTLDQVAGHAARWFVRHLIRAEARGGATAPVVA